jgi:hypothetical protein
MDLPNLPPTGRAEPDSPQTAGIASLPVEVLTAISGALAWGTGRITGMGTSMLKG